MRLPKNDVLMPTLFVALIFPAAAGGWWRYFSGYADQRANPAVHMQMPVPGPVVKASESGDSLLRAAHSVAYRGAAGASIRRTSTVVERPVRLGQDAAESYLSPNKLQACGIAQAASGFDGFYLSAEAAE